MELGDLAKKPAARSPVSNAVSKAVDQSADTFEILEGLEGVRHNPSMYLGNLGSDMAYRKVKEVVDNCFDEAMAGRNSYIEVVMDLDNNWYVVADKAGGIPIEMKVLKDGSKLSILTAAYTRLHAGGKFNDKAYKVSAGCFVGDTKVYTLDGKSPTFKELYDRWQYDRTPIPCLSLDPKTNQVKVSNIYHVQLSKYVDRLVVVTLDDGTKIKSTIDHPYYTSDGKKVKAANLKAGTSLNAVHFREDKDGYVESSRLKMQTGSSRLHRFVSKEKGENIQGVHVHHIDEDIKNNAPDNLVAKTPYDHYREHPNHLRIWKRYLKRSGSEKAQMLRAMNVDEDVQISQQVGKIRRVGMRCLLETSELNCDVFTKYRMKGCASWRKAVSYFGNADSLKDFINYEYQLWQDDENKGSYLRELSFVMYALDGYVLTNDHTPDMKARRDMGHVSKVSKHMRGVSMLAFEKARKLHGSSCCLTASRLDTLYGWDNVVQFIQTGTIPSLSTSFKDDDIERAVLACSDRRANVHRTAGLRTILEIVEAGETLNAETFNSRTKHGCAKFEMFAKLLELRFGVARKRTAFIEYAQLLSGKVMREAEEQYGRSAIQNVLSSVHKLLKAGYTFNKSNYINYRQTVLGVKSAPSYDRVVMIAKRLGCTGRGGLVDLARAYNHSVVSVEIEDCEPTAVYGISVENEHNYLLDAGVFVGNTHGVGVAAVNAVSDSLQVWTCRSNILYTQKFKKGEIEGPSNPVKVKAYSPEVKNYLAESKYGTVVMFQPDQTVISEDALRDKRKQAKVLRVAQPEVGRVATWLRTMADLNPKLKIVLTVIRGKKRKTKTYYNDKDLNYYIKNKVDEYDLGTFGKPLVFKTDFTTVAVQWTEYESDDRFESYVNNSPTSDGGTHVRGFLDALATAVKPYETASDRKVTKGAARKVQVAQYKKEDLLTGLVGAFDWRMHGAAYTSQVKDKLASNVTQEVYDIMLPVFVSYFEANTSVPKKLLTRARELNKGREALAKTVRSLADAKKSGRGATLPGILSQSETKNPEERELYSVEGDSAAGSGKNARNPFYQEIFKCKGKPVNAMNLPLDRVLDNETIQGLIISLGLDLNSLDVKAPHPKFECKNLRIGKLMLLSDADVDGYHINTLILTFLFKYVPDIFKQGRVFVVNAPLFNVIHKGVHYGAMTREEVLAIAPKTVKPNEVQRAKGWGEVSEELLSIIAFDPKYRKLIKINPLANKEHEEWFIGITSDDRVAKRKMLGIEEQVI